MGCSEAAIATLSGKELLRPLSIDFKNNEILIDTKVLAEIRNRVRDLLTYDVTFLFFELPDPTTARVQLLKMGTAPRDPNQDVAHTYLQEMWRNHSQGESGKDSRFLSRHGIMRSEVVVNTKEKVGLIFSPIGLSHGALAATLGTQNYGSIIGGTRYSPKKSGEYPRFERQNSLSYSQLDGIGAEEANFKVVFKP